MGSLDGYSHKFKVMLKNLNQFVDITDQSIEKIILDEKNINKSIHDIKNELFFVKNMLEKKEYDKAQDKIDNILCEYPSDNPRHFPIL